MTEKGERLRAENNNTKQITQKERKGAATSNTRNYQGEMLHEHNFFLHIIFIIV